MISFAYAKGSSGFFTTRLEEVNGELMLRILFSRLRDTFHSRRMEEELEQELHEHLTLLADRFIRLGLTPDEAMYAARRQLGGVTQMKEDVRSRRILPHIDIWVQNVRYAFRQLRKDKAFTICAAFTLALGIGASTAVFAILDTVVLRPLPFSEPSRLVAFGPLDRRGVPHPTDLSYPNFFDFRTQNSVFTHLVSYRSGGFTLSGSLPALQVSGEIVSWDLFPLLGIQPEFGRGFLPTEERPGTHVVILSNALWKSRFNGDLQILNKPVHINGRLYTVAGIAPPGFRFPLDRPDVQLWTTLSEDSIVSEFTPLTQQRGARVINTIGRLKNGITIAQARSQMDVIGTRLARLDPDNNKNFAATWIEPERDHLADNTRKPLWILLGAVLLVLLIACANAASLLLARSTERAREFVLRTALGASRSVLVRQLLAESLALGTLGCLGGVLLGAMALRVIVWLAGENIPIPRFYDARIDPRILTFAVVLTLLTSALFGLAPAVQAIGKNLTGPLQLSSLHVVRGRHRLRSGFVIGQITLGLVLLVAAELLIANFLFLLQRDPGFRPDHLLTFDISVSDARYNNAAQISFSDRLLERLRNLPGVRVAASGMPLPLQGHQMSVSFDIEERPTLAPDRPHADIAIVTPDYFEAMGIRLLKGRWFTNRDDVNGPRVLVVNEAFAHKYFPGENVIGKRIMSGATNGKEGMILRQIVGVVDNAKQAPWTADADPIYYFPYKQLSWGIGTIILKTTVPPLTVEKEARAALISLDREVPMFDMQTGEDLASDAIRLPRILMVMMAGFAGTALLLTVVGLYGVLAYAVETRRREIGVRIAVGARRKQVINLVLREATQLVILGLALGIVGALGVQKLLASLAFGISSEKSIFLAVPCGAMLAASLLAAYLPARHAASVDPVQALRND